MVGQTRVARVSRLSATTTGSTALSRKTSSGSISSPRAKRYNSTVGEKIVREFVGSLVGHGSNKGVLFTTDRFAESAKRFVRSIPQRIVLVDGPELARLMVKHRVGVTVTKTLDLTRVDSDYFDTETDI
jgi:restriction system protein